MSELGTMVPVCLECACERKLVLDDDCVILCTTCGAVFDLDEITDLYEESDDDDGNPGEDVHTGRLSKSGE